MYIISENTHFKQELIKPSTGVELYATADNNPFEAWIDKYSRLFMQRLLGNVLFNDFDNYMINGVLTGAPLKWTNLQNGVTYSYQNKSYTWKGLLFTEGLNEESLIAYYVFATWYEYQLTQLTNFGEAKGKAVNSTMGGGGIRQYKAWNTFVRAYQGKHKYVKNHYDYWCNHFRYDLYKDNWLDYTYNESSYVSLIDFLIHNEDDYPDAEKKLYGIKNMFSI